MSMAVPVQPVVGPRTCYRVDGTPKAIYSDSRTARKVAARYPEQHLHPYTCPRCAGVHLARKRSVET